MQAARSLTLNRNRLRDFLQTESAALASTLRVYAWRAGLPADESAVGELLNETVLEALDHAERYDPERSPRAWLLGIAANLVRRQQASTARLQAREPLAADLAPENALLSEAEIFERLALLGVQEDPAENDDGQARQVREAVGHLSASDQLVLHLFSEGGLSGEALAQALGTTPGAARVRLHRALNRLRQRLPPDQEANDD